MDLPLEPMLLPVGGDRGGILPAEAGGAEAGVPAGEQPRAFQAEVAQGVHADDLRDLLRGVAVCDQVLRAVDIRAVPAGRDEGRRADPHMDLRRARVPQQADRLPAGGAPHDGIVDEDQALPLHHGADGVQLQSHAGLPLPLGGSDERPADVLVLRKADLIGDAGGSGVADGGVQPGVRDADHRVRLHRVLRRQEGPGPPARPADPGPIDHRIGPGKIDELEYAQPARHAAAAAPVRAHAGGVRRHHLAGLDIPQKLRAHRVQGAALGGEDDHPVLPAAHAQGPEAEGVPGGDQLRRGGDHQGVGPLQLVHGGGDGLLDAAAAEPLLHDHVGDDLGIRGGVEDGAPLLQPVPQLQGIGQVPVVGQGHAPLAVVDQQGLDVMPAVGAGGGVAHVAHGDAALPQGPEPVPGEDLAHKARIPEGAEHAVVVHHDPRALLPPVLEGVQPAVDQGRKLGPLRREHAENAALLPELSAGHAVIPHPGGRRSPPRRCGP